MTSAQMLDRVQKLLDTTVSSTSFWTTDNVYQGLSDGQREAVNRVLAVYNAKLQAGFTPAPPKAIEKLISYPTSSSDVTSGNNYATLPSTFLQDISVKYDYANSGTFKHLAKRDYDKSFYDSNSYKSNWWYAIADGKIWFGVAASGTGKYQMVHIQKPTEITAAIEPVLPDFTHEAIVQYCVCEMLKRDKYFNEAQGFFNQFLKLVEAFA